MWYQYVSINMGCTFLNDPHSLSKIHFNDIIMGAMAFQIASLTIVYSTVYSSTDQKNPSNSASLAFVRGIQQGPGNSPHKWPVTWKMFPFDDVIMKLKEKQDDNSHWWEETIHYAILTRFTLLWRWIKKLSDWMLFCEFIAITIKCRLKKTQWWSDISIKPLNACIHLSGFGLCGNIDLL